MTFWYLEMCAAIAEGDIGRVFEVLKVCLLLSILRACMLIRMQVLRFSFWGAGSTN
jgi:hypothetical protein